MILLKKLRLHLKEKEQRNSLKYAVGEEIIVALAHSDATYEESRAS